MAGDEVWGYSTEECLARVDESVRHRRPPACPQLLTVDETATLLRTTPNAIRHMICRGQLPGVVKIGRRTLVRSEDLRRLVGLLHASPSNDLAERR